jgi:hypothetical protein
MFRGEYADLLGIAVKQAKTLQFYGLVSGTTLTGYEAPVEIGLGGKFYQTTVCFLSDLPAGIDNILGQVGFFDRFSVRLELQKIVIQER